MQNHLVSPRFVLELLYYMEEGMTIHSSILAWRIPWIEEPGSPQGHESDMSKVT